MSLIAQTAAQKARLAGFKASLRVRGRVATVGSENEDDNEQQITLLVDDAAMIADPDRPAQAENPVYVVVACLAQSIEDPRSVTQFTEVATSKVRKVIEFLESDGDQISWKWRCESQRDKY